MAVQVKKGKKIHFFKVFLAYMHNQQNAQKWCQTNNINSRAMQRVLDVRGQLQRYLKRFKIPIVSAKAEKTPEKVIRSIIAGYFCNAAQLQPDGTYKTLRSSHVCTFTEIDFCPTKFLTKLLLIS